jgi:hypothetical protein
MMEKGKTTVLAWVGEDELGSGQVGIKRVLMRIPGFQQPMYAALAFTADQGAKAKLTDADLRGALQAQADLGGKTLRLVRFEAVEVLEEIKPKGGNNH